MLFFFFQAEDGIRDSSVTGVQTCALPISVHPRQGVFQLPGVPAGRSLLDLPGDRDSHLRGARARAVGADGVVGAAAHQLSVVAAGKIRVEEVPVTTPP